MMRGHLRDPGLSFLWSPPGKEYHSVLREHASLARGTTPPPLPNALEYSLLDREIYISFRGILCSGGIIPWVVQYPWRATPNNRG